MTIVIRATSAWSRTQARPDPGLRPCRRHPVDVGDLRHGCRSFFNATCPGRIEVHADQGGPIYVGGREATLKRFNENYYEARSGNVTISLTIRPDGTPDVSYTGKGRANGVSQIKTAPDDGMNRSGDARPEPRGRRSAGVSMGALPDQCRREATEEFDVRQSDVTTNRAFQSGERIVVQGNFSDGGRMTFFNCWFDADGNFVSVN